MIVLANLIGFALTSATLVGLILLGWHSMIIPPY